MSKLTKQEQQKRTKSRPPTKRIQQNIKSGVITFVVGVLFWGIVKLIIEPNEAALTINLHYSGYSLLRNCFAAVGSIGFVCSAGTAVMCLIMFIKYYFQARNEAMARAAEEIEAARQADKAKPSLKTPEDVRDYLASMVVGVVAEYPRNLVLDLIGQLDRMNELQSRLETLLSVNGVTTLSETVTLFQDIEDALCMTSTGHLINHYIVGGEPEFLAHCEQTKQDNDELLSQAQGALQDVANYINGETTIDEVKARIEAFRSATRNFIDEEVPIHEKLFQTVPGTGSVAASGH